MNKTWIGGLLSLGLATLLSTTAAAQGPRGGGMGMRMGLGMLIGNESVQKELKLDEAQTSKAKELAEESMAKMRENFESVRDLEGPERMQKMQELNRELNASVEKSAEAFLKPEQLKRLSQIELQQRGAMAFLDPKVQEKLKITDDQKSSIESISRESMEEMRSLFTSGGDREEMRAKMTEIQKSTREKIEGKLTDDQKKAWKELVGAPFEIRREGPGRGRGR
jgi:hypothetical protein